MSYDQIKIADQNDLIHYLQRYGFLMQFCESEIDFVVQGMDVMAKVVYVQQYMDKRPYQNACVQTFDQFLNLYKHLVFVVKISNETKIQQLPNVQLERNQDYNDCNVLRTASCSMSCGE